MTNLPVVEPVSTFCERGDDGLIRQYDMVTGQILAVIGDPDTIDKFPEELIQIEHEGKMLLVQKNLPLEGLFREAMKFQPILGDLICKEVANGLSPKKVLEKMNIDYDVYARWRRQNKEFAQALNQALQDRADYLADCALEEAHDASPTPGGAQKAKLIVDTLWKSAEVANAQRYSSRVKVDSGPNHATVIVIETGIRRVGDPGFFVDETAKIRNVTPESKSGEVVPSLAVSLPKTPVPQEKSKPSGAGHE